MKKILIKIKNSVFRISKNFIIFLLIFSIPTQIFAASVISDGALTDSEILENNVVIQQYFPKGSVTITATDTPSILSWINPNLAFKNDLGPEESLDGFIDSNSTVLNFRNGIEKQISEPLEIPLATSSMDSVLETENIKTELKDLTLNKISAEQEKITDEGTKSSSTEITAWTQEIILAQTDLGVENKKEEPVSQIEEQRNSTTTTFHEADSVLTNLGFKTQVLEKTEKLNESENIIVKKTSTSTDANLVFDELFFSSTTQEIIATSTLQVENLNTGKENLEIFPKVISEIVSEKQTDPTLTDSKISSPKLEYFNFSLEESYLLDFETLSSFALNLSLASKKIPGAILFVEYQTTSTTWQSLAEIDLTQGVSNLQNNGFINIPLSKALFKFVSELKIRLSYQLPFEFKGESQDLLFLDSVWLETRYEQENGELTDTELLEMSPKLLDPEEFLKMSFSNEALDLSLPGNLDNPIVFSGNSALNQSPKLQLVMAGTRPSTTAERLDNKVAYKEAFLNTDVEYEITESGLKEAIILKNKNHPSRFRYLLNLDEFDYIQESDSKIQLYEKGYKGKSLKLLYILSAPYMIDSEGEISKSLKFAVNKNLLTLTPDKNWLKTAVYPVVVDPTVEIQVLNVHSQPVAGEYWNVDFTTVGTENLIITPADQATVNDMQFATLTCGEEDRTSGAQILEGDIIFYPNWNCDDVATISHLDLRTANHKLNFQFGDASAEAFNAAYVWDGGGGDAQWTTAANWSSDIVPGSSDTATFDNTCVTNCSPTIATTTTIAGLTMSAGYTGTLTQGNGYSFTVIGNFTMASGTFIGGSSTTTFTDYFTISGGTFVAASSTVFGPADGGGRIININSSQTFERLQFNNSVGNYSRTITSGDTLVVTGDLILSDGSLNTGTIDVRGNIYQSSTFDGGTTVLDFGNDSVNQTLSLSGGSGLIVRLNSAADATDTILFNTASSLFGVTTTPDFLGTIPISNAGNYAVTIGSGGSGSWEQAAGTYTQGNYTFTLSGSFTLSGGSFVGSNSTTTFTDYFTISGGTFVAASSTVFGPADGGGRIININSSQTFERLQFNNSVGNYSRTITSDDTLVVTGDLILSDGSLNTGTMEARGNVQILSGFDSGTTALTFGGSATQTFDLTGATGIFNGDITVNKSGGEVQLVSALTLDAASQDLNITEGIFNINGYNLTANGSSGTLVVQDGGTFKLQGGETITTNSSYPEFQSGSAVIYSTSSSVSIKDYNYKHLTISGGGIYTATSSTLNIAGNFFNDASTFTHNNGTINLTGVDQYIFGTSTFYNLTKSSTTAATLYFSATSTQTIANTLTLTGASGGVLSIRSTASGTQARLDSQGTESISYLNVKDSYNINASDINAQGTYSTDLGNNDGWIFEAVISQGDYRFYENINQLQPTVDIGTLNSSVVIISTSSPIRLRMNLLVSDYNLSTTTSNFKLQVSSYTNSNWNDVSINPDEWYDESWLNRRKIIFNNSSATENLTDFPVLVSLNESSNIDYSKTQNSGQDIRFVDSDGSTLLNYEIEKWDETSTSTVWVKVPQISSASSTDYIWMYYNNPGATDNSTTTGVWDSNYRFVHHLDDTTATTTIVDSTSNNIIGTKLSTTEPNATSTEISDGAQYFDGSNDRVIINDTTDPTAYTISAWIKPVDATAINIFVRTTSAGPGAAWSHQLRMNATGTIEAYTFDGGTKTVFGSTVLTPSNWYYVTAVAQNSGNMRVYLNGVEEGTAASIATLWTGGDRYYFGSNSASGMGFFSGIIDELRFSSSVRSPSWIQAEYKNGAGIFNSFETEQSATSTQWNFYNNASVTSSTTISTVLLPSSDILGSYQEGNPTALNPFAVNAGQYIEYDWVLDPSNVVLGATYYFRMVYSDGTVLDSYANLPELSLISDNAPNSPTSLGPSTVVGGSWINDNTPTFTFNLTDPDVGNTVRYKIEISTSSSFSTLLLDYSSATATQGSASFTVGQATSTGTYTTGTTGQVLSDSSDGYYWRVKTIDNLGANSSFSTANSGAVAFKLDTVVPTAGSLALATTSPTSLTATISGASDSLSGLATASYVFNNSTTGTNSSATSASSWLSSGLTPNTPYTFYADVFDVAGNYASTVTISIYTLANLPTSLSLNQDSQTQLTASWNANSNPAGTEYYVLNATASTSPDWSSSTSQIFSGLTCGTSYDFVVKARNSSNIETAYTSTTTQSTATCATLGDEGSGGGGGGGGGVPTPLEEGFGVVINAGASTTVDSLTTLTLQATADTAYMAISNTPDFKNAVLQLFATATQWNLCEQKTCRAGFYTVYVKYFNSQMQAKQTVSSGIQLLVKDKTPTPNPPLVENLPLAAILTVSMDRKIWSDKLIGEEPLNNVSLRVAVSGTAKGQITYEYDCTNDGIYELTRRTTNEFVTHRNVCNFAKAGAYTIRVKVTRGVNIVESFASVLVEPAEDTLVKVVEPQVSPPVVVIEPPSTETPVVVVPQNTPPLPDASPGPLSNNLPLANLFENISSSIISVSEGLVSGLSNTGNLIKNSISVMSNTTILPLVTILKQGSSLFSQELETKVVVSVSALVVAPSSLVMEYSLAKYGLVGNFTNLTEFWLHIVATLQGLMSSFGLRRRRRYWGTVYDSVTKQPLDPVIVEMINFETGKVTEQAITDLSGRFGFMDKPGNFLIKAKKTNYQFPSTKILGKMDGVFENLYHGELMQITKSGEVLSPNIPMDPLAFDWNQTGKLKYVNFHPRLETFFHLILEIIFWGSASFSLLALLLKPNLFGLIFVGVFGLLFILKRFIPHRKLWGSLTSQNHPTHFLIIEISPKSIPSVVLGKAMTNEKGRFFLKAPKGEYILRVMQTVEDKVILLKNQIIKVDNQGVVNQNISLDD